jgi:hypothetical protein
VSVSRRPVFVTDLAVLETAASVKRTASKGEDGTTSNGAAVLTLSRNKRWTSHVVLFFTYVDVLETAASVKGTASKGEDGTALKAARTDAFPR